MSSESANQATSSSDWRGARGEKWRAGLVPMEAMLEPIDEPLIDALALDAPLRIADVGCGGGATAFSILRRAPLRSIVHGFDISPALIEAARARTERGQQAIAFEVADMSSTPAPAQLYDRLVSRFGVMSFDDPDAAFSNLARWLAPSGRFAFAVWGPAADNAWLTPVREVVAGIVQLPSPDPDAPGPFRYAEVGKLLGLLERTGFADLASHEWCGALSVGRLPAAEAATFALASFSSFADLLARAGDDAFARAHRALTARFLPHQRDGAVWLGASVHIVTGARSKAVP